MSRENLEVVRAAAEAWAAGDFDEVARLYKPEANITAVPEGWPEPAPVEGLDAVIEQFMRLQEGSDEHSLTIEREVADGDWVVTDFRWHMRGTASGVSMTSEIAAAYRLEDAKIAEARFFWKWEDAMGSVGLSD